MAEWEAFNKIEPIGEERRDYRFSYLMTVISNIAISAFGGKGKSKMTKVSDFEFLWDTTRPKEAQTIGNMKEILMGMAGKK